MKGSEKQVAWATELQAAAIETMEEALRTFGASAQAVDLVTARIEALRNAEYAGDVIDIFGGFRRTGNLREDFSRVCVPYKIHHPNTNGQRAILIKK